MAKHRDTKTRSYEIQDAIVLELRTLSLDRLLEVLRLAQRLNAEQDDQRRKFDDKMEGDK